MAPCKYARNRMGGNCVFRGWKEDFRHAGRDRRLFLHIDGFGSDLVNQLDSNSRLECDRLFERRNQTHRCRSLFLPLRLCKLGNQLEQHGQ